MWVEFKRAPNLMAAEIWKEVLEAEGLPSRILRTATSGIGASASPS